MADTLPLNFPIPIETAITSYPYTDIQEGTGMVNFSGDRVSIDGTAGNDLYILSTASGLIPSVTSTTVTSANTINFDVVFNTPKIVNGTGYVIIPFNCTGTAALTPTFRVYHYDGSTETAISSAITVPTGTAGGGTTYFERIGTFSVTNVNFKRGETLRLKLTFADGGAGDRALFHVPGSTNSNFTQTGGKLSLLAPFRLLL